MSNKITVDLRYNKDIQNFREKYIKWKEKGKILIIEVISEKKSKQINSFFHVCVNWWRINEFRHHGRIGSFAAAKEYIKTNILADIFISFDPGYGNNYIRSWSDIDQSEATKAMNNFLDHCKGCNYEMPDAERFKSDYQYAAMQRRDSETYIEKIERELLIYGVQTKLEDENL